MMKFLLRLFTWWNGETLNTALYTRRNGERVGEDDLGNVYYRSRGGKIAPVLGKERRWVIYKGVSEASMVPPGWNGWLHHTVDVPPTRETYVPHPWQQPHKPNLTGTPLAYRPSGSTLSVGVRPPATGDYESWSPAD